MIVRVVENCLVDYIKKNDIQDDIEKYALRYYDYELEGETSFVNAINNIVNNFDINNVINSWDEFDGCCLEVVDYISFEVIQ